MAVELYTSSFFCVLFLVVFIPVRRVRMSVPHLAIILWLACVNMIRGINALVWNGNVDVRGSVWCDIATKFMLGCNIALPAAFLCVSRKLELLGSSRTFSMDSKTVRNRRLLELFLCYVVPVIYVALHPLSQDHRFDLAKEYGCSPAIHNSFVALGFIWIPPLILCSITLALSCYSIHHTSRVSYPHFVVHIESRTNITSSIFFRQLSTSFVMTAALIIITIFSIFSAPSLVPWSSWNAVHSQLWKINVVTDAAQLDTKHADWWIFFALSVLYIFLLFTIGEEARDALKWVVLQLRTKRQLPKLRRLHLPLFHSRPQAEAAGGSTTHLVVKTPPPQLELKSGWDDMLDTRTVKWKLLSRKGTPSPSPPSPTPSSNMDEDRAFMVSTLSYLGSPTAKSLGISSPPHVQPTLLSPQAALPKPPQLVLEIPAVPKPPPPPVLTGSPGVSPLRTKPVRTDVPPVGIEIPIISMSPSPQAPASVGAQAISPVGVKPVPHDLPPENMSTVSSVLRAPWPVPPTVPEPVIPSPSTLTSTTMTRSPSTSPSYSPTTSEGGMHGYHALTPSNRQLSPVGTVGVSTVFDASSVTVKKPLKSALKRPSRKEQAGFQGEHLRVVQETA